MELSVSKLCECDVQAWTALLRAQPQWQAATARRVTARPMQRGWSGAALVGYTVTLGSGQVLTFVGKRISDYESRVLAMLSDQPPIELPRVHFARDGWCVMEALPPGKPPVEWTTDDVRTALTNLARLHATYWNSAPEPLDRLDAVGLNQRLDRAARGLSLVERAGGWPELIELRVMRAMRRVLDERARFLAPLLNQPVTLLHGDAWTPNWHITKDRCVLLDWSAAAVGPAAWDANYFLEVAAVYKAANSQWHVCLPPVAHDEAVAFYLDQLKVALGRSVDRAAFKAALRSAFVVNTLSLWLGFVEEYGVWANVMLGAGWLLARLPAGLRRTAENLVLSHQGDFLRQAFARFESYVTSDASAVNC